MVPSLASSICTPYEDNILIIYKFTTAFFNTSLAAGGFQIASCIMCVVYTYNVHFIMYAIIQQLCGQ